MKKIIFIDASAEKDLGKLPEEIEKKFRAYLDLLEITGTLTFPEARKVTQELFEIRVQHKGIYRGFYAYVNGNVVVLLHIYVKKTQKTPLKHLKTAIQRLGKYK